MLRFVVLLLGLMAMLGVSQEAPAATAGIEQASSLDDQEDCGCCPVDEEPGDCCDTDFGACCATGLVCVVPTTMARGWSLGLPETCVPMHLLRPRDNGPPPTPPPID